MEPAELAEAASRTIAAMKRLGELLRLDDRDASVVQPVSLKSVFLAGLTHDQKKRWLFSRRLTLVSGWELRMTAYGSDYGRYARQVFDPCGRPRCIQFPSSLYRGLEGGLDDTSEEAVYAWLISVKALIESSPERAMRMPLTVG